MSEPTAPGVGTVGWFDLTVPDAPKVRDFYQAVVGWTASDVDMGGYQDYCLHPAGENQPPVAGVCHAREHNAGLPAQWLIYITVRNLDASMDRCLELGGQVIAGPRSISGMG